MTHTHIDASQIVAPHKGSADRLLDAMASQGWSGRPLLVRPLGDGYQALTGSHRLATAKQLGITVPVLLIEDADLDADGWNAMDACSDDDDLLAVLRERNLEDAANLLAQEPNLQ